MDVLKVSQFILFVTCLSPFLNSQAFGLSSTGILDDTQTLDAEESELWLCADQTYKIFRGQLCDDVPDCNDKSDEGDKICGNLKCEFRCLETRKCLSYIQVCNFVPECGSGDNSDELNCEITGYKCKDSQTACSDDPERCYGDDQKCDGMAFCRDGSDETLCTQNNEVIAVTTISVKKNKRKSKGKSRGKKTRKLRKNRKRKTDDTREFWKNSCQSWKTCNKKSKKQLVKSAFKQCLKDPSGNICTWKPVKRFSLKKCKRVQRKRKFAKPCESLVATLKSSKQS
uniref:Prolow-density lipoprotein receptor-related protein 1-like n=1 Tax=Phallusia mammillata TaxID=59560 RepID=A0A6F9DKD0_9ASCI|nr:prolow-density lipoprotein receptor-related protein 1-like [Phallusia mammillata]